MSGTEHLDSRLQKETKGHQCQPERHQAPVEMTAVLPDQPRKHLPFFVTLPTPSLEYLMSKREGGGGRPGGKATCSEGGEDANQT